HDALVNTLDPGIHLAALALTDTHPGLFGQLQQNTDTGVAAPLGQPDLLDTLGMVAQQRLDRMQTVDSFEITHDLALRLRGAPSAAGLPPALAFAFGLPELRSEERRVGKECRAGR